MEKIKVAVIGAGGKMGTRTSKNLVDFPACSRAYRKRAWIKSYSGR